jgi:hypothetical protein
LKHRLFMTLGLALLMSASLSTPAMADVFTYSLTIDHCDGGCGTAPFGTITVTDFAPNEVSLDIELGPNFFVQGGQPGSTVGFNLNNTPEIGDLAIVSSSLPDWSLDSPSAGSLHFDGFGDFEYSLNCCDGIIGGGHKQPGSETVMISGTGLRAASFHELSTGPGSVPVYFAVDIYSNATGNTGPVGAVNEPLNPVVPEPTSIVLLGTVAALIIGLKRRRLAA